MVLSWDLRVVGRAAPGRSDAMNRRTLWGGLAATLALAGCYASHGDEEADDAGVDDGARDDAWDDGGPPDTDADPGDDGASDDGDADVPEAVGICDEPPDGLWFEFSVNGESYEERDIDSPCRIMDVDAEGGRQMVTLECGTGAMMETYVLDVYGSVPLYFDLWVGSEVWFRYVADPVWWVNRHLTIRWMGGEAPGELLFAAISADDIVPRGHTVEDWYGPWGVEVVSGLCAPVTESCGTMERQAIQLTAYGSTVRVLNGGVGYAKMMVSVALAVTQARRYTDNRCDDWPDTFYTAMLVQIPEG
jgi:hypothetical protein